MYEKLLLVSKSILLLCIAAIISVFCYLIFSNPEFNFVLSEKINKEVEIKNMKKAEELQQWKWFEWADVDTDSEKYPLVVLRSGFKIIKVSNDEALIGWKMDVLNTSKKNTYKVEINYSITDEDSFVINTSTESKWVKAEDFGTIKSTMKVNISNLDRLKFDTWYISVPGWDEKEKSVTTKRYDRMAKLVANDDKCPYWIAKIVKNKGSALLSMSDKWKVIHDAISKSKEKK